MLPFVVRWSYEPWPESVRGVDLQIENKRDDRLFPRETAVLYASQLVHASRLEKRRTIR